MRRTLGIDQRPKVFFEVHRFESIFFVDDYVNVGDDGKCKDTLTIQGCAYIPYNFVS